MAVTEEQRKADLQDKYGYRGVKADEIQTTKAVITNYGFTRRVMEHDDFDVESVVRRESRRKLEEHLDKVGTDHPGHIRRYHWIAENGDHKFMYISEVI